MRTINDGDVVNLERIVPEVGLHCGQDLVCFTTGQQPQARCGAHFDVRLFLHSAVPAVMVEGME